VTLELAAGAHAFVGAAAAGGPLLLAVLAGAAKLRSGRASVLDDAPRARADLAWVPIAPLLPGALTAAEILALGARLRGGDARAPLARLEAFALGPIADRRAATLSPSELHALALIAALTSPAKVLLLEEPLGHLDARAAPAMIEAIRTRASEGACIVVATASERDARALGASTWHVRGGLCVKADDDRARDFARVTGIRVLGPDLQRLADALADDVRAQGIAWQGTDLVVKGSDPLALATAIGAEIAATGVVVDMLEPLEVVPR
jgi:ABC-type multidrug transport system ATPase subunit